MEKEENDQLAFFDGSLKRGYLLDDWKRGKEEPVSCRIIIT